MTSRRSFAFLIGAASALASGNAAAVVGGTVDTTWSAVAAIILNNGGGTSVCTAFAVHPQWFVTAKHCLAQNTSGSPTIEVEIGLVAHDYPVTQTYSDPNSDVALAYIDTPAEILPFKVNSAALSAASDVGRKVGMLGWGLTSASDTAPLDRHFGRTTIAGVTATQLSNGYAPAGACFSDDGAPLFVFDTDGFPMALGMVSSFDANCALADVSERIDAALAFINSHVIACTHGAICEGIFRAVFEDPL